MRGAARLRVGCGQSSGSCPDPWFCGEDEESPSERIAAYVEALLERWRDITEDVEETSPWAAGPLIGGAGGPVIYFALRWDRAEEASAYAAALADSMGLICFDPQQRQLRP
ncbi:hypothetical protein ABZX74_36705 [Streptomyces olivaceoviridis]|uniref:hypothetical protein n=1 Tax=Streptomyces olivaceoviridis TaxID=1921 RepID=UPI0033B268C5